MDQPSGIYIKKITNFLCNILCALGLWKPYGESETRIILYSTYSIVFLFIFAILYAVLMVCDIFFLTDFSDLTNRLYMSLTEAALAIKVINFSINNLEWQQILIEIKEFPINLLQDEKIIRKRARIFQTVIYVYFFFPNCAVHALGIAPLFTETTDLIFSGWYPGFDWRNNRKDYWFVYAYQYIGIFITCNLNVVIDSYYCFVMHMLSAQINIFGRHLSAMQVNKKKTIERIRLDLIEKIHTHQRLNSTFELFQKNLQWTYFCQVLLSSIVICSVTKELARANNSEELALFVSTALTAMALTMQIFLMCLFGQETMSEYESLSYELYSSDWPEMLNISKRNESKNCQMVLTIFMETLKRNNKVLVGKVYPLSLPTFNSILMMAYRLFAIVK